jgi:hypothetical protein
LMVAKEPVKIIEIENTPIVRESVQPAAVPAEVETEVQSEKITPSLIIAVENEKPAMTQKPQVIQDNLPLVPFESSPHVWSFSEYKNTYHKDETPKEDPLIQNKNVTHHVPSGVVTSAPLHSELGEEITLEKTPMTKGDESLVVLASFMLFAIILILGYMYSNGRL